MTRTEMNAGFVLADVEGTPERGIDGAQPAVFDDEV